MTTAAPEPKANMGQPIPRYDAVAKVTGKAEYAADVALVRPAYAYLITSAISKGRVTAMEVEEATKLRGVLEIITHENAEKLKDAKLFSAGGYLSTSNQPLKSADIAEDGQIIGVVLAETYEAAREAANRVRVSYNAAKPTATLDSPGTTSAPARGQFARHKDDPHVGNFAKAFAESEVQFEATYETPPQHHNPMELFATSCVWYGDRLTIYEPSQYVHGLKNGVAAQLGIDADKVRVVNSYVGGAFGSKGSMTPRTAIIANLARALKRPVKLVATREQGFKSRPIAPRPGTRSGSAPTITASSPRSAMRVGSCPRAPTLTRSAAPPPRRACMIAPMSRASFPSCAPTATRPDSCARRPRCPTCSRWKARWTRSRICSAWTRSSCAASKTP
jgi:xanthine dehydrogenase YagR molybdenum-binding subunit